MSPWPVRVRGSSVWCMTMLSTRLEGKAKSGTSSLMSAEGHDDGHATDDEGPHRRTADGAEGPKNPGGGGHRAQWDRTLPFGRGGACGRQGVGSAGRSRQNRG